MSISIKYKVINCTLLSIGCISLLLGIMGIFLPLLPTTPFILLASACFIRSSPRLSGWLQQHPVFGTVLSNWQQHRGMTAKLKYRVMLMTILSFSLSIMLISIPWVQVMLAVGGLLLLFGLSRVNTIH